MDDRDRTTKVETVKGDTHDLLADAKGRAKSGGETLDRAARGDDAPLGERVEDGI